MNYREADGADKIAAFERGMTDQKAHLVFETSGVHTFIVSETYLVAYQIHRRGLTRYLTVAAVDMLYAGPGTKADVAEFLTAEARKFDAWVEVQM